MPMGKRAGEADYPENLLELIEAFLRELRFSEAPATAGLDEAMRYSLLAGGKRIRPVLALATARAAGSEPRSVLPTAAAIELIHTYSLIHDDLPAMDDDVLRRGRPTSHVVYGENIAILAGDGLFAEALRLVADRQEGPAERVLDALRLIGSATGVGGMVGGQYVDVTTPATSSASEREARTVSRAEGPAAGAAGSPLGPEGLRSLHELKTGKLIATSVRVSLALAGMREPETIPYGRFAEELGVLFQIVDDILDVTGEETALGKPQGSDERHGKLTYVSVLGLDRARELAAESHAEARRALAGAGGDTRDLKRITDFIHTRQR